MDLHVAATESGHRLIGDGPDVALVNRFLGHLAARNFAGATQRAYAYDLLCFGRFCAERGLSVTVLSPTDVFDWLEWQAGRARGSAMRELRSVVPLREVRGSAPASMNRRVAALRGLCEYAVLAGVRPDNPCRRHDARAARGCAAGCSGILGPAGRVDRGGWFGLHAGCRSPSNRPRWPGSSPT